MSPPEQIVCNTVDKLIILLFQNKAIYFGTNKVLSLVI